MDTVAAKIQKLYVVVQNGEDTWSEAESEGSGFSSFSI